MGATQAEARSATRRHILCILVPLVLIGSVLPRSLLAATDDFFPYGVWRSWQPALFAGNPSSDDLRFQFQINLDVLGQGLGASGFYGRFSQRSLWDLSHDARGFRVDSSYEPQVLLLLDEGSMSRLLSAWPAGLALETSYLHQSNGWEGELSRIWNRLVLQAYLGSPRGSTWSGSVSWWAPFRVEGTNDDITRYAGDGEISVNVQPRRPVAVLGHTRLRLVSRYSFDAYHGGFFTNLEASFFFVPRFFARPPFPKPSDGSADAAPSFALLVQWFVGTGESLTDYRRSQNVVRIGIGVL